MTPVIRNNQSWIPSIFNDFFDGEFARTRTTAPSINVMESDKGYKVEVAAPGMGKEDFNVSLNQEGDLVISMEKKEEQKDNGENCGEKKCNCRYLRREFNYYTKFQQTLIMPDDVERDQINAKVENGVLTIKLPKKNPEQAPKVSRQIEIG